MTDVKKDDKLVIVGIEIPQVEVTQLLSGSETKISAAVNNLTGEHNTFVQSIEKTYSDNAKALAKVAESTEKIFDKVIADLTNAMGLQFATSKTQIEEIAGLTKELDVELKNKAINLARVQKATENLQGIYQEQERSLKATVDVEILKHKRNAINAYMTEQGLEAVDAGTVTKIQSKYDALNQNFEKEIDKVKKEEAAKGHAGISAALANQASNHKAETADLNAANKSLNERVIELQKQITKLETEKTEMRNLENEKIKNMAAGSSANVYVDQNKK